MNGLHQRDISSVQLFFSQSTVNISMNKNEIMAVVFMAIKFGESH